MTGTVSEINAARGMVAVLTSDGDYSILEMAGADMPDTGDRVEWQEHEPLGPGRVHNRTQARSCSAYFQNHHVSRARLRQQLLLE